MTTTNVVDDGQGARDHRRRSFGRNQTDNTYVNFKSTPLARNLVDELTVDKF